MIYLRQENERRCGDIALRHLLSVVFHDRRYLVTGIELPDGASMADMQGAAASYGLALRGYRVINPSACRTIKGPFIGLIGKGSRSHYVLIVRRRRQWLIVDGSGPPRWISNDDYHQLAVGYALIKVNSAKKERCHKPRLAFRLEGRFLNTCLYLLSLLALLGGLYLIDVSVSFMLPLMCLTAAFMLMIVQSRTMRATMKRFDETTECWLNRVNNREEFVAWYQFKQLLFSKDMDWLNHVLIVGMGSLMQLANDLFNAIPLVVMALMVVLINRWMVPSIRQDTERLASLESECFSKHDGSMARFKQITSLSYRVADKTMLLRLLIVVLVVMTSLLFMALRGHVYLNYFLFQSASYYLIVDHGRSLINYQDRQQLYFQLYYHFFVR